MIFKKNVLDVIDLYHYFILDIWGVIHDGLHLYSGVIDSILELNRRQKKICFLSNAPRRATKVENLLNSFGITKNLYEFVFTSGELLYSFLERNEHHKYSKIGKNYYYIGPKKDLDLLDGLNYNIQQDYRNVDFILVTGFSNDKESIEEKVPLLEIMVKRRLKMICANPDLIVITKDKKEMMCAGVIAKYYEKLGGEVIYFGKPKNSSYDAIKKKFHLQSNERIIAVGDGPETDILGSSNSGIDNALICGGILSNELGISHGEFPTKSNLENILIKYKVRPNFILSKL